MRLFGSGSLGFRLAASLLAVQVAAVAGWLLLLMTVSPYLSYEELAASSAHDRIASGLVLGPRGWVLERPPSLERYLAGRPDLEFAVAADGRIIAASTPGFARTLAPSLPAMGAGGELWALDGSVIRTSPIVRPEGRLLVATRGDAFRVEDSPMLFLAYLPQLLLIFAPALLAAATLSAWAVWRAMAGVRQAAAAAAEIDVASLDRRLGEEGVPREVAPFVQAINRLLQRLQDGIRRRDLFIANAAHELRTPVAILSARIDALEAPQRGALQRDVRRLGILVDQLLAAARLRRRDRVEFRRLDLHHLLRSVLANMAPLALREGRDLELVADDGPCWLWGDGEALRSAAANLVDNALRAEPPGGRITARLLEGDADVRLEIIDRGPGVEPADREAIFEPFWRSRPNGDGAGLGLAIVRSVVTAHGGRIWVEPTPGGGATFVAEFPVDEGLGRETG